MHALKLSCFYKKFRLYQLLLRHPILSCVSFLVYSQITFTEFSIMKETIPKPNFDSWMEEYFGMKEKMAMEENFRMEEKMATAASSKAESANSDNILWHCVCKDTLYGRRLCSLSRGSIPK